MKKLILSLIALLPLLCACAEVPTDPDERAEFKQTNDPLEPMNRKIFVANQYLDNHVAEPVAKGYRDVAPEGVQRGLHNVLTNLKAPYVAGNDLLQGKTHDSADELGRFMINTVFGVLGIWDVVDGSGGAKPHENDLGITLGVWGVGEGPFLMLPLLGPSNPRDAGARVASYWVDPVNYAIGTYGTAPTIAKIGVGALDSRTQLIEPLDEIKRNSLDLYGTLRSLYRQQRRSAIGNGPGEETSELIP